MRIASSWLLNVGLFYFGLEMLSLLIVVLQLGLQLLIRQILAALHHLLVQSQDLFLKHVLAHLKHVLRTEVLVRKLIQLHMVHLLVQLLGVHLVVERELVDAKQFAAVFASYYLVVRYNSWHLAALLGLIHLQPVLHKSVGCLLVADLALRWNRLAFNCQLHKLVP